MRSGLIAVWLQFEWRYLLRITLDRAAGRGVTRALLNRWRREERSVQHCCVCTPVSFALGVEACAVHEIAKREDILRSWLHVRTVLLQHILFAYSDSTSCRV